MIDKTGCKKMMVSAENYEICNILARKLGMCDTDILNLFIEVASNVIMIKYDLIRGYDENKKL